MASDRYDQMLDFAEQEMRRGGFGAVSFRDVAAAVGIKSASVHYHFPTKADLGRAVTKRYGDRFMAALGTPEADAPANLAHLADAYIAAHDAAAATCLCAVLGAVVETLPEAASLEVDGFYDRLLAWVAEAIDGRDTALTPHTVIALLQGAMALAIARRSRAPLDEARALLLGSI